ncbi:MAG: hypothetical protein AAFX99_09925 [Myxococcota bacterium]
MTMMNVRANYYHTARTRAVFTQLIRVICPSEAEELGIVEEVVDRLELAMQACPTQIRVAQLVGMNTFEELARLDPRNLGRPFSALDRSRALRWYDSWWHSDVTLFKTFARLIKTLITAEYYEHPVVRGQLEYHPDQWIAKVAKRRLESYAEDIRKMDAEVTAPDPLQVASTADEMAEETMAEQVLSSETVPVPA